MRFARFLSGGFITAIVVNSLERKLEKCNAVQCIKYWQIKNCCKVLATWNFCKVEKILKGRLE